MKLRFLLTNGQVLRAWIRRAHVPRWGERLVITVWDPGDPEREVKRDYDCKGIAHRPSGLTMVRELVYEWMEQYLPADQV